MNQNAKELFYNQLKHKIFKAGALILSHSEQTIGKFSPLTTARARILGIMIRLGAPVTVPFLAHELGLTRQAVGRVVNAMITENLLQPRENPLHQTSKLLTVTTAGVKAYNHVFETQSPLSRTPPACLSEEELQTTVKALDAIIETFEQLVRQPDNLPRD